MKKVSALGFLIPASGAKKEPRVTNHMAGRGNHNAHWRRWVLWVFSCHHFIILSMSPCDLMPAPPSMHHRALAKRWGLPRQGGWRAVAITMHHYIILFMSSCDLKNSTADKITQIQDELINHGVEQREKIFTSHMWLCSIIAALTRSSKTQWST